MEKMMENSKGQMFCVADIVKRAKLAMGFRRDNELAAYLGVSRSTLSNWVARNSIDFPLLLERMKEVDYNWLLTGKGSPQPQEGYCDSRLASGVVERLHQPRGAEALADRSVRLYDVSAAANLHTLLDGSPQYALGDIQIPGVPRCDGAVYVSGDSMYPILKAGDIIGFRCLKDLDEIIYGEMYLVSFHLGGDDYLVVKYVNRSEREGHIRLVSYNPHHDPIDIPLGSIDAMGIVKFSIRKNMMR